MNLYLFTSGLAFDENNVVIFSSSLVFIEKDIFLLLSNSADISAWSTLLSIISSLPFKFLITLLLSR